jgi:transposase-like protein
MDFRKRAIAFMDEGHTFAELKRAFNIFPSTLVSWRKLAGESGTLAPRRIPGRPPKIDIDSLKQAVAEKPDAYLRELAAPYGCSVVAVFNALHKYNITHKKRPRSEVALKQGRFV